MKPACGIFTYTTSNGVPSLVEKSKYFIQNVSTNLTENKWSFISCGFSLQNNSILNDEINSTISDGKKVKNFVLNVNNEKHAMTIDNKDFSVENYNEDTAYTIHIKNFGNAVLIKRLALFNYFRNFSNSKI